MLETAWPEFSSATPAASPISSNVPLPRLWKRKFGLIVVGDEDVDEAVAIVIGEGDAHAAALMLRDPRLLRHVLEGAVAAIAIERIGEPLEIHRVAVDAHVARGVAAKTVVADRPLGVIHHQQIEQAIVVVVEPARGHGPPIALDACLLR